LKIKKKKREKTLERVTGKRERAKRGCGWRASRRGQEQGTSIACISRPPKVVGAAAVGADIAVFFSLPLTWNVPLSCRPLA